MKKKSRYEILDETPRRYGLYVHKTNGSVAIAYPPNPETGRWAIDKGEVRKHPLFRVSYGVVQEGTGNYFFNSALRNYELLDEGDYGAEK